MTWVGLLNAIRDRLESAFKYNTTDTDALRVLATGKSVGGAVIPIPIPVAADGMSIPTQDAGPAAGAGVLQMPVHGDYSSATQVLRNASYGKRWQVTDIIFSSAAALEFILTDTAGVTIFGPILCAANGSYQWTMRSKFLLPTEATGIKLDTTAADHVTLQLGVVEVPA